MATRRRSRRQTAEADTALGEDQNRPVRPGHLPPVTAPSPTDPAVIERERWSERLLERLDAPMGALGVLFARLVIGETVSQPTGAVAVGFTVVSWVLWLVFALEFVVRAVAAPSTTTFLRRNWWQLIFLALPFLRFLRFLGALRSIRRGARVRTCRCHRCSGRAGAPAANSRIASHGSPSRPCASSSAAARSSTSSPER